MSKLVDKERLAKLAQALDGRAKAAVAAEEARAKAAEQAAQSVADQAAADILAINNPENGILKQAKDYADGKDAAINAKVDFNVYDAKIKLIDQKDGEQDQSIQDLEAAVEQLQEKMGEGDLAGVDKKINDAVAELETADTSLGNRIAVFEANGAKDVAALMNRADALEEKVGHDKVEGEAPQAATGLFLEVDEAKAAAEAAAQAAAAEKTRALAQESAIRQELANEKAALQKEIDDDIAAESALRAAEEERIEGLVSAEAQRAAGKEASLQGEIDAAEGRLDALEAKFAGEESVDAKIAKVAQDVVDEKERAEGVEADLDEAIEAEVSRAKGEEEKLDAAIKAEASRADAAEKANAQAIADMKDVTKDSSLAKQIADEVTRAKGVESGLETRVAANEAKFVGLEKNTVQAAIDQAEVDAKAYADQQITALVDSAPDAMNTLNELAQAINAHNDVYEEYVSTVSSNIATAKQEAIDAAASDAAGKDAALKSELQAEIEAAVKVEADRAKEEEQAIETAFAAADTKLKSDLQAEIDADVKVEKERAEGAEKALADRLDVLEGEGKGSVAKAVKDAVDAENQRAVARENDIETAYKAADTALGNRITTLEGLVVGGEGEGLEAVIADVAKNKTDIANLQAKDTELEGKITDNTSAIEKLNGAADVEGSVAKSITDALKPYSTTEEMKVILANVVNSLALSMEDNKMVLKLGGVEGVALSETSLDMATDDDINAIIAGLDAE